MESGPSTSKLCKHFTSPRNKRKMSHISGNEKNIIVRFYKYVQETWPIDKYQSKTEMKIITADTLGIGKATVYRVLKEYKENGTVGPPASPKKSTKLVESVNDFDKSCIRKKVHEININSELPTLDKILQAVNSDDKLPNFSRTSLWRLLKHLKIKYAKENNDIMLR